MTSQSADPLAARLIIAGSYFVTSTVGMVAYVLLLCVLYRHRAKYHQKHSLYMLLWNLAVGDVGEFVTHYVVAIPLSFMAAPLYGDGALLIAVSNLETIFFHINHFTTFFIAANRMCVFVRLKLYQKLFEGEKIYYSVAMVYAMVVVQVVLSVFSNHHKKFNHLNFIFYYTSPHNTTEMIEDYTAVDALYHAYSTMINYLPMVSLCMYIMATVGLKMVHQGTNSNKALERRLMVQGLIISLVTQVQIFGFRWATEIVDFTFQVFKSRIVGSLIMGNLVIINSAVNPFIYFIFNASIRQHVLEILGIKAKVQTITAVRVVKPTAQ